MKTLAELKQMSFIPHHECGVCASWVGWEVALNKPNPYFNPSCVCGCSEGHYDTWRKVFDWYNTVFEKESNLAVQAAWNMEVAVMADNRDPGFAISTEPRRGNVRPITMENITSPITSRLDKFINQPAIREAIENHKSNWIPDSKGGEPNCRR